MVRGQIESRGISSRLVLKALETVPRHEFVPAEHRSHSCDDGPLPIGAGQTISQPYIVALMTESAEVGPGMKVLEIGTGCGYQAAVLAECGAEVFTIEIVESLCRQAKETLKRLGYRVNVRCGDGYAGWKEEGPFNAILVTAAPEEIPPPLLAQLADGGRLVIPVGAESQTLELVRRMGDRFVRETIIPVRFVPMTGRARKKD